MLFDHAQVDALISLSNEKFIFEEVHHSFGLLFLNFTKGGKTESIRATFRINPREAIKAEDFATFVNDDENFIDLSAELIGSMNSETRSVLEFRSSTDVSIVKKMLEFPSLGQKLEGVWNLQLTNEFHITNDSGAFKTELSDNRLPLFTGRMFNQFETTKEHSGYWIDEAEGRRVLLGKTADTGQRLDYQSYRWLHRRIASSTNTRTLISTIAPPMVFTEVNSTTLKVIDSGINEIEQCYWCGVANSMVLDWLIRQSITTTLNMFYLYQLPVPRLPSADPHCISIANRTALLICTTPEFNDLAKAVGLKPLAGAGSSPHPNPLPGGEGTRQKYGATDPAERAKLRAELDGLVAHLYGLTEAEFAHILGTFPLVPEPTKIAALNAWRDIQKGLIS